MNVSLQITKRGGFPAMKPDTWRICPSQLAKKRFGHLHFCQVNLKYLKRNILKIHLFMQYITITANTCKYINDFCNKHTNETYFIFNTLHNFNFYS